MNVPLVEIIVELHWTPADAQPATPRGAQMLPGMALASMPSFGAEEFFMRYSGKISQRGYQNIERLIPPGFPILVNHLAYRFRSTANSSSSLYQIGAGVFTVNGTPPYKDWKTFRPVVVDGITALIESLRNTDEEFEFSGLSLRYIDVFDDSYIQGRNSHEFLRDGLGISLTPSEALLSAVHCIGAMRPTVQLTLPTKNSAVFGLLAGEGEAGGRKGFVLDTSISTTSSVSGNLDSLMNILDAFQSDLHNAFAELTKPFHPILQKETQQ